MSKTGSGIAYGYNADGKRISKTVNGTTHNYSYLGDQLTEMTWGSSKLSFAPIQKSRTDGFWTAYVPKEKRLLYEKRTLKSEESALHLYAKALLYDNNVFCGSFGGNGIWGLPRI